MPAVTAGAARSRRRSGVGRRPSGPPAGVRDGRDRRLRGRHHRAPRVHQGLDLRPGERPGQVGHGPARLEGHRRVLVHVVHEEHPLAQAGQGLLHLLAVEAALGARRHSFQSLEQAVLVPLGLQAADEPGAGVGQALVVEVHRVLGGEQDAHPERAGLLEQGQSGFLDGGSATGGKKPKISSM